MATRINKYLSEVGYCSRRVADSLIEEGKVTINGEIPKTIGTITVCKCAENKRKKNKFI